MTEKDDEAKFNETLKRLLKSPPKPHKPKDDAHGHDPARDRQDQDRPDRRGRKQE
ncbi:MAG TPA: hypothetical protein VGN80_07490 [Devosiaceae bacterium]|jgi:hypothetical protein|nr:hypothetical protein [Devosiaceae bacterium]